MGIQFVDNLTSTTLERKGSEPMRFEFIDVQWLHHFEAEPTRLVSELDENRMETRKLEFFRDGRVGYACAGHTAYGTELGLVPVPSLSEISSDPEFVGAMITAAEFDILWSTHVR
ncbi:DUF6881 domain-containing protein [Cupriavidus pauculus]|nr:hypothetical protein [Cupriavidus pauculus]